MNAAWLKDERFVDLLVKQATEGLSPPEQAEIDRLLATHPDADRDIMARTAAAVTLAADFKEEPLPRALRERLQADAARWLATRDSGVVDLAARRDARAPSKTSPLPWLAAAACLVLAVLGWWPRLREDAEPQQAAVEPPVVETTPEPAPTPAQEREQLLASGNAVTKSEWSGTAEAASQGMSGDIVWDNQAKKGYLRFTGLAANDPGQSQYQLWIFDKQQDERYPIDGGVFDIPAGATEVVVPIDAKIGVTEPVMFAVTIEKPGGVVVSAREHIVALAKVAAG